VSAALGAVVLFVAACGGTKPIGRPVATQPPAAAATDGDTPEANLRVQLTDLLNQHVALASAATGAALGGRTAEFQAAAATLDQNSVAIAHLIGSVYGSDAETAFLQGWRNHIGFFVDYTQADATHDEAKKQKALDDLNNYALQVAQFFNAANGMPLDATVTLMKQHVVTLTSVIDAQAAGDQTAVYSKLATSMAHMEMVADPIAAATARKFPQRFAVNR
jgi:hypothetical protein